MKLDNPSLMISSQQKKPAKSSFRWCDSGLRHYRPLLDSEISSCVGFQKFLRHIGQPSTVRPRSVHGPSTVNMSLLSRGSQNRVSTRGRGGHVIGRRSWRASHRPWEGLQADAPRSWWFFGGRAARLRGPS